MEYDYLFKTVIVGDYGVGKTCLNHRVSDDTFGEVYLSNIGIDFHTRTIVVDGVRVKLQIWDTYGQERFSTISTSYYRGADGIMLAYDITNVKSFHDIEIWLKAIDDKHSQPKSVCKLLVGTKCDLTDKKLFQSHIGSYEEQLPHQFQQRAPSSAHRLLQVGDSVDTTPPFRDMREVDYPSAVEYAKEHKLIGAIETSAKESINVELAFVTLAAAILQQKRGITRNMEEREQVESSMTQESHSWGCSRM